MTKEINLSESAFTSPTEFDTVPIVYYRLRRPLKAGAQLPHMKMENIFYGAADDFQFSFTSNTTFSCYNNKEVLKAIVHSSDSKNNMLKEIYINSINSIASKDLWRKVEDFLINYPEQDKLKNLDDVLISKERDIKLHLDNKLVQLDEPLKKILKYLTFLDATNYSQVDTIIYILARYYGYGMKLYEKMSTRLIKNPSYD